VRKNKMCVEIVGEITIRNETCYQDLVQILLWNNYGVEIMPIENGEKLKITIVKTNEEDE
jgi:hypothetical protein